MKALEKSSNWCSVPSTLKQSVENVEVASGARTNLAFAFSTTVSTLIKTHFHMQRDAPLCGPGGILSCLHITTPKAMISFKNSFSNDCLITFSFERRSESVSRKLEHTRAGIGSRKMRVYEGLSTPMLLAGKYPARL